MEADSQESVVESHLMSALRKFKAPESMALVGKLYD
jgi:hypothetical protein